ncbi:hypothetical protein FJT64_010922 [Amphibalanus amphitrite]|uniref:Uncharacterized protein n=1 Tax=Amphibalanus amphitrite TaxID=1232801 RepID=A0A6A4VCL5_AMPAM|nr:hypothetical protein FJT64_010922 [Amphibalanus amphitrite]
MEQFFIANGVKEEEEVRRRAIFLSVVGSDVFSLLEDLIAPATQHAETEDCPARRLRCYRCHAVGHVRAACRAGWSPRVYHLDDDGLEAFRDGGGPGPWTENHGSGVMDTRQSSGAAAAGECRAAAEESGPAYLEGTKFNLMNDKMVSQLGLELSKAVIPSLTTADGSELATRGCAWVEMAVNDGPGKATMFVVVKDLTDDVLIGLDTLKKLKASIQCGEMQVTVKRVPEAVLDQYPSLFARDGEDIGRVKNFQYKTYAEYDKDLRSGVQKKTKEALENIKKGCVVERKSRGETDSLKEVS